MQLLKDRTLNDLLRELSCVELAAAAAGPQTAGNQAEQEESDGYNSTVSIAWN
jgi:ribosomal protein L12E/L44/L45/RPP1/RPP2